MSVLPTNIHCYTIIIRGEGRGKSVIIVSLLVIIWMASYCALVSMLVFNIKPNANTLLKNASALLLN